MDDESLLPPETIAARDQLDEMLRANQQHFGPSGVTIEQDLLPEELPVGECLLSEWILVAAWIDDKGKPFLTRIKSKNLLEHHMDGLLHKALYDF